MPEASLAPRVSDAVAAGTATLAAAGVDTPRLDAELLLGSALGVDRARLLIDGSDAVPEAARARYDELLARRAAREPVAYILGRKDFRRVSLAVDPRVLIPRPETELLVEVGLSLGRGARVVDVGTGSGAVALALKDERPDLDVWGIDLSTGAVAVARDNASRLGLDARFVVGDLLDGVEVGFDAVLANLPYVADGAALAPEIARYEPAGALFAGPDGLDVIRRLVGMLDGVNRGGARGRATTRPTRSRRWSGRPGLARCNACATSPGTSAWWSVAGEPGRGVRALHVGRRGCGVPGRHRLRAGLRPVQPPGGRAPVSVQAPQPGQAVGGDVLRPVAGVRCAAGAGAGHSRRAGQAPARPDRRAGAQPRRAVRAGVRRRSRDARPAGDPLRGARRRQVAGAAVQRQPGRRRRPAALGRGARANPPSEPTW